jgi:hypothetical protein
MNNFLVKLGSKVSDDVWLDKIELVSDKPDVPFTVSLEGKTLNLDHVNQLRTDMNSALQNGDLEVSNAAPATSDDGQSFFSWTIKNKAAAPTSATENPGASPSPAGNRKGGGPPPGGMAAP